MHVCFGHDRRGSISSSPPLLQKHGLVPQMEEAGTPYVAEEVTVSSEDFRLYFLFVQVVGDSSRASQ